MRQRVLTVEGMRQGVRDSVNFLPVLTKSLLDRPFCLLEFQTAIDEGKPIRLLVEEDDRFHPFDRAAWHAFDAAPAVVRTERRDEVKCEIAERHECGLVQPLGAGWVQTDPARDLWSRDEQVCVAPGSPFDGLPEAIRVAISAALPEAVTYRRRDFEVEAMMQALCARSGVVLPRPPPLAAAGTPGEVFVICSRPSSAAMAAALQQALEASGRVTLCFSDDPDPPELAAADRMLCVCAASSVEPTTAHQLLHTNYCIPTTAYQLLHTFKLLRSRSPKIRIGCAAR